MPKKETTKERRARHVVKYINESTSTTAAVKELSESLFISERSVYRDFKKNID